MTTPLETKASILVEWYKMNKDDPQYNEFFEYNDLGTPLAISINANLCTITKTGSLVIEETWKELCKWQLQNPEGDYQSIQDMLPNWIDDYEDYEDDDDSVELLEVLAKDKDASVRSGVAYTANCPVGLLEVLAKDKHESVRSGVADNANSPFELLEILAKDKHENVRWSVAQNANCPVELLEILAKDKGETKELKSIGKKLNDY